MDLYIIGASPDGLPAGEATPSRQANMGGRHPQRPDSIYTGHDGDRAGLDQNLKSAARNYLRLRTSRRSTRAARSSAGEACMAPAWRRRQ